MQQSHILNPIQPIFSFIHINIAAGNYNDESIRRTAKATNITREVREKLNPQYTDGYYHSINWT